jgi:hypothetical protein
MRLLGGIKKLLHDDGTTIKGVQRILREKGVAHVAALSPGLEDEPVKSDSANDSKVVPFTAHPTPVEDSQIGMDLSAPVTAQSNGQDPAPVTLTEPAGEDALDTAPLLGGIASRTWQVPDFDPQLLRRIAPIAKDLRAWLDRVDAQPAG